MKAQNLIFFKWLVYTNSWVGMGAILQTIFTISLFKLPFPSISNLVFMGVTPIFLYSFLKMSGLETTHFYAPNSQEEFMQKNFSFYKNWIWVTGGFVLYLIYHLEYYKNSSFLALACTVLIYFFWRTNPSLIQSYKRVQSFFKILFIGFCWSFFTLFFPTLVMPKTANFWVWFLAQTLLFTLLLFPFEEKDKVRDRETGSLNLMNLWSEKSIQKMQKFGFVSLLFLYTYLFILPFFSFFIFVYLLLILGFLWFLLKIGKAEMACYFWIDGILVFQSFAMIFII